MRRFVFCALMICVLLASNKLNANAVEKVPSDIRKSCDYWGAQYGISSELLQGLSYTESRWIEDAQNGNCKGLCQINIYIYKDKIKNLGIDDIFDADQNIHLCADILYDLFSVNDDLYYVLSAYNAGNNGISNYNKGIYSSYVKKISQLSAELEQERYGK